MNASVLAPGLVIAGKYALERPLARGAMGEVWIARHRTLGNEIAIKFLARAPAHEGEDEETAMARFQFEAQVASKLSRRTRHIVAVTDHGEELGFAYLVMELVEGESLETWMRRQGRTTLADLAPIVAQIAKGLTAAHSEGVFHRDLKPANVLLARDEDGGLLAKILDFGIAKTVRSHKVETHQPGHSTEVGIVLGTPNYMSPEQARGLATLDHRCDLWALSTLVYEALCGCLPYDGETTADLLVNVCSVDPVPARTHRPDLPPSADVFFNKAFAAKVKDRHQDAASLAAEFAKVVADAQPPKPRLEIAEIEGAATLTPAEEKSIAGVVDAAPYEPPRRRAPVYVALGALAVLVVTIVVFARRAPETAPAAQPIVAPKSSAPVIEKASVDPPVAPAPTPTQVAPTPTAAPTTAPSTKTKYFKIVGPPDPTSKPAGTPTPAPTPTQVTPPPPPSTKKPVDKGEIL